MRKKENANKDSGGRKYILDFHRIFRYKIIGVR